MLTCEKEVRVDGDKVLKVHYLPAWSRQRTRYVKPLFWTILLGLSGVFLVFHQITVGEGAVR